MLTQFGWVLLMGFFGGALNAVIVDKGILWPIWTKRSGRRFLELGFFANVVLGIAAAILVWLIDPLNVIGKVVEGDIKTLLGIAFASAMGGGSVLNNLIHLAVPTRESETITDLKNTVTSLGDSIKRLSAEIEHLRREGSERRPRQ